MSIAKLARPEIQALEPYEAAVQVDDTIRLNANEAPWTGRADHFRRPLNRYPEIRPTRLRAQLAKRYGCSPDNLLVTRGTSEAIDLLIRVFCQAGKNNIVTTRPSFSMYRHYALVQGAELREVETRRDTDFAIDVDALASACDEATRLIFVCSPNNPTGTLLPRDALLKLLESSRGRAAVVVDEAYVEFAGEASAIDLLDQYDNLVVLRTLSKALAYAGARCGAVISQTEIIDMVNAVQAPYALATPVVEYVENALQTENRDEADAWLARIISERQRLADELAALTFVRKIWPSSANFLLVQVDDALAVMEQCQSAKVLLRHFGGELADCVRISVGAPDENERLLGALAAMERA